MIKFEAPLRVPKSKFKDFILNLNNYRNAHYYTLNKTKVEFNKAMDKKYPDHIEPICCEIVTQYKVYGATKRKFDLPNVCSIVQKYFEDWLVARGVIPTDDYTVIVSSVYLFGGVDKENPRVDIEILY